MINVSFTAQKLRQHNKKNRARVLQPAGEGKENQTMYFSHKVRAFSLILTTLKVYLKDKTWFYNKSWDQV